MNSKHGTHEYKNMSHSLDGMNVYFILPETKTGHRAWYTSFILNGVH
jgi:hypothetical protein